MLGGLLHCCFGGNFVDQQNIILHKNCQLNKLASDICFMSCLIKGDNHTGVLAIGFMPTRGVDFPHIVGWSTAPALSYDARYTGIG